MDFDKTIQLVQRSDKNVNLDPISKGVLSSFREEKDICLIRFTLTLLAFVGLEHNHRPSRHVSYL